MGLRPGHCYTQIERSYTRKSKYKRKAFIKTVPPTKIAKYDMGDLKKDFEYQIDLISKQDIQIRHNALESARQMIIRSLEKMNRPYHTKLRVYPHHALRENKMLTGAGADRMQTGMQQSFGKVIGCAAQVKKNQPVFTVYVDKSEVGLASSALETAIARLPCRCDILVKNRKK